jgi:alpha-L-rhamnosidase
MSFGDWAAPGSESGGGLLSAPEGSLFTAPGVPLPTADADLYAEARTLARIARTLGRAGDARRYSALADRLGRAFEATFFDPRTDTFHNGRSVGYRQTSNLVALAHDLVPAGRERAVYGHLVADIHARGDHLNTGAIGTKLLLPTLTAHGDTDLAYRIATQTTYPSWGYWVRQGATTSWETWSHRAAIQSLDHAFLGTVVDWLDHDVAGIQAAAPGFARVRIRPTPPARLAHAAATIGTPRGSVSSSWRRRGRSLTLTVSIPGNTRAEVDVPGRAVRVVAGRGARFERRAGGYAIYAVGGGRHAWRAKVRQKGK